MTQQLISRRQLLRSAAVGGAAVSCSGWLKSLACAAQEHSPPRAKSVILLWLNGGPATIDLWDLKPGHENGGPFQEIETSAPGLRISENFPRLAKHGRDLAVIRSITSKEGDHSQAVHLARTGYIPQASIDFPALGSLVASELGDLESILPNFVSIAPPRRTVLAGSGFLGAHYSPFVVGEQAVSVHDLDVADLVRIKGVSAEEHAKRSRLLAELDSAFLARQTGVLTESLQAASNRALRMMQPTTIEAFALEEESQAVRDAYGRGLFGQGCLLARRLVERGVSFVEVALDGWDTHQDNFNRVRALSTELDNAFASLMNDLQQRDLLDSTLVVCQGEFGRTPKINKNTGRDHWPRVWSAVLAGGGIQGGGAVGKSSADGSEVLERPCTVPDVIATVSTALGIDPRKQNISNVNRPIRIADPDATPLKELL